MKTARRAICLVAILVSFCDCLPPLPLEKDKESSGDAEPVVLTSGGYIRGRSVRFVDGRINGHNVSVGDDDVNVTTVNSFYGIPYARPPVGELRFRHPVALAQMWSGIRDGRRKASICVQHLSIEGVLTVDRGSEDCLYLNVFAPARNRVGTNGSAVLVYLHGGSFAVGAGSEDRFEGAVLAAAGDVVVVTVNYRLGFFGFSYSGTEDSPGNAGVYDVIAALQWVRDNAQHFGGRPDSVTLAGNSAGAALAGVLAYSPMTVGLIRRVALISGVPELLSIVGYAVESAVRVGLALATRAGCGDNSTAVSDVRRAFRCLKQLPVAVLNLLQSKVPVYSPVVDGAAVVAYNESSVIEMVNRSIDLLIGNTRDDGSYLLLNPFPFMEDRPNLTISSQQLLAVISGHGRRYNFTKAQRLSLEHQYFNWLDPSNDEENLRMASDLATDRIYTCPSVKLANQFAIHGLQREIEAFVYQFNYRSFEIGFPSWQGVHHCSDIAYLFGHPLRLPGYGQAEAELSVRFMNHFGKFVNVGNPSSDDCEWPAVTVSGPKCLTFSLHNTRVEFGPRSKECALWTNVLPNMGEDCLTEKRSEN